MANVRVNDLSVILDSADIRGILPSTSPANAAWSEERLAEAWGAGILGCVREADGSG